MLVSIICPTRKRTTKLIRMIRSVADTVSSKSNYEVCLRVHADDHLTLTMLPEILSLGNVRAHIGPALTWAENYQAFNEAQQISRGKWVWLMNDDCVIEGGGWDTQLSNLPSPAIAIPETHRLGKSTYHRDRALPMFLMPNTPPGCLWMPKEGDTGLWSLYKDWNPNWLTGITLWHDRDEPDCHRINDL